MDHSIKYSKLNDDRSIAMDFGYGEFMKWEIEEYGFALVSLSIAISFFYLWQEIQTLLGHLVVQWLEAMLS